MTTLAASAQTSGNATANAISPVVSFLPAVTYATGGGTSWVAVADVNRDGKPDLIVANTDGGSENNGTEDGSVAVLLGNGDGTFQAPKTYDSGGVYAESVFVADVNGDGKLDVVVANGCAKGTSFGINCSAEGVIGVLLGNGDGTFQAALSYTSGSWKGANFAQSYAAVADVNRDGKPDIVVADACGTSNCASGGVSILLGNGNGTFQPPVTYASGGNTALMLIVADVNGDGIPDVVAANFFSGNVGVLLGNGDGTFQPAVDYPAGFLKGTSSVAVADVNGDGKPDLITGNCGSYGCAPNDGGEIGILLGNGDGTFQTAVKYDPGTEPRWIAVADMNGDGAPDIVLADWGVGTISGGNSGAASVLLGNGNGTFQPAQIFPSGGNEVPSVVVADVNGDGKPDILAACVAFQSTPGVVSVLLNNTSSTTTETALSYSINPVLVGQYVTYTATVASQNGTVTGTVKFQDDGVTVATIAVSNNQANFKTKYEAVGVQSLTATYSGDSDHQSSTSPVLTQDVVATSKTTVATSGSPSLIGQPVTFTATVTSAYGAISDGETIPFYDGTTQIGTGTTAGGAASFSTSALAVKTHTIKASYAGDVSFKPSFGTVQQVVEAYATTTSLSVNPNSSNFGQAVVLTAVVATAGSTTPTGKVTFYDGTSSLGTKTLDSTGTAILTTAKLPVGTDSLTTTYTGDSLNAKSTSSPFAQTVNQAQITMTATSSPSPSSVGKSVKFTATLSSTGSLPNGQLVTFSYNGGTLGTATISTKGIASFSTTALPAGQDVVTATYAGSTDYSSASASVTQAVN